MFEEMHSDLYKVEFWQELQAENSRWFCIWMYFPTVAPGALIAAKTLYWRCFLTRVSNLAQRDFGT